MITFLTWSCSETEVEPATSLSTASKQASKDVTLNKKIPIVFNTIATGTLADGSTYLGEVEAIGGINAKGSYIMPTEIHGMALYCTLILTLPNGTITIRMNCNMTTSNGQWKILKGTGSYKILAGGGSLVMPDDVREILTGTIFWK